MEEVTLDGLPSLAFGPRSTPSIGRKHFPHNLRGSQKLSVTEEESLWTNSSALPNDRSQIPTPGIQDKSRCPERPQHRLSITRLDAPSDFIKQCIPAEHVNILSILEARRDSQVTHQFLGAASVKEVRPPISCAKPI